MSDNKYDILIVGVGGQGVLLASELISEAAMNHGLDVKKSEVHGMSQRGGVVTSHVRVAPKVYSPTIQHGKADVLMAFEQAEGLRALNWMKTDGVAIISTTRLVPAIVTSSKDFNYPDDAIAEIKQRCSNSIIVEGDKIALELGNARLVNTILLGALAAYLPFSDDAWAEVIKSKVKAKFVDLNLEAFKKGQTFQLTPVDA